MKLLLVLFSADNSISDKVAKVNHRTIFLFETVNEAMGDYFV